MFSQTSQSSVRAAVLHISLLIPVFTHTQTPLSFLMHLLNYSFKDGSIVPGKTSQTNWKTFSVTSISHLPTIFIFPTVFIFHSNLLNSQDSKPQISSQLKITNQKSYPFFPFSATCSKFFFQHKDPGISSCFKRNTQKAKDIKNLSDLRR